MERLLPAGAAQDTDAQRRRPHRRLILREIARRALLEQEHELLLAAVAAGKGADGDAAAAASAPTTTATTAPPPRAPWRYWPRLVSFAGAQRGLRLADLEGDFLLAANVLNVLASAGYVGVNYARGYLDAHVGFTDALYIALALAFVADAVLYLYSWQGAWPAPGRAALAAEYLNIAASVGYTLTACLYTVEFTEDVVLCVLVAETAFVAAFLADALLYTYAWLASVPPRVRGRGCTPRDADCWANALNVAPAALYVVASVVGLWVHETQRRNYAAVAGGGSVGAPADPADVDPGGAHPALRAMSRINVWADALYLADALVVCASWWRDLALELAPARGPGLTVALRLDGSGGGGGGGGCDDGGGDGDEWLHTPTGLLLPPLLPPPAAAAPGEAPRERRATLRVTAAVAAPPPSSSSGSGGGAVPSSAASSASFQLAPPLRLARADGRSLSVTTVDVEASSLAGDALLGALRGPPRRGGGGGAGGWEDEWGEEGGEDDDEEGYRVCGECTARRRAGGSVDG